MRFPRVVWLVAILSASGSCLCAQPDFSCTAPRCDKVGSRIAHGVLTDGWFGSCAAICDLGWTSCAGANDSCDCVAVSDAPDPPLPPQWLYRLTDLPHGLAVCGSSIFVVDGTELVRLRIDDPNPVTIAETLPIPADPSGGIACDDLGGVVFGGTFDGGGAVLRFGDAGIGPWVTGVAPGRGIVTSGSLAALPSAGDAGRELVLLADGGVVSLGALDETGIDYPFTANAFALRWLDDGSVREQALAPADAGDAGLDASDADGGDADAGIPAERAVAIASDDASVVLVRSRPGDGGTLTYGLDPLDAGRLTDVRAVARVAGATYVALDDGLVRIDVNGTRTLRASWSRFREMFVTDKFVYWIQVEIYNGVDHGMLYRVLR